MNKFIRAITDLDVGAVKEFLQKDSKWIGWSEKSGRNALHYLCGIDVSNDTQKAEASLQIFKLLLKSGLDINSIHRIPEKEGHFPATPLWYAYTRGRNEKLWIYLLKHGADPDNCMFAITWYDDVKAARLFKKYGAKTTDKDGKDTPFMAAWFWKKFDMAEWLLKNGAEVNMTDPQGRTPLLYAVWKKYDIEHIKLLLRYGADPDIEDKKGLSARKLAQSKGPRKIHDLFEG